MKIGKNLMIEETLDGTFTVWNGYSYHMLTHIPAEVIAEFVEKIYKIANEQDTKYGCYRNNPLWKNIGINEEDIEYKQEAN